MYREEEEKVRYVGSDIYSTGVVRFVFGMLLVFSAARWQRTYDDLKSLLLQERFLSDDRLNSYLIEKLGPKELERSRITFLRLCQSASNCGIVPPFIYYESRQMVAPKFRTAACVIYKNVSTILTAIMCYLYDAVTYKKHVTDMIQDTYNKRFCKYKNEYESIRALTSFRNSSSVDSMDWFNILVVRDPLERFISAFVNKCLKETKREAVCYNCGNDIQCLMEHQYERLMGDAQTPSTRHTVEDAHFAPQSWHCELRDSLRKYKIIKYSASSANETLNELGFVLREIGVPDEILDDIRMQLTRKRTHHQTYQTKERVFYENQVRSSPYLMKLLVKMFYYDYLLFGFPLPEVR